MKLINDPARLRRILINLINKAREENGWPTSINDTREGYENHHNQARSIGGANHHENLTRFNFKQHAFAHHISAYLWYGDLMHTWLSMSRNGKLTLRQIAEIRREAAIKSAALRGEVKVKVPGNIRHRTQSNRPKSGFIGVYISPTGKDRPYFVAPIVEGVTYRLGSYSDARQAAIDYDIAILQLVAGEETPRNFPELSLMELRRLSLSFRVPVPVVPKPEPVKKGYAWSEERKAAARGKKRSPEARERIRLAQIGKKHSAETRAKMAASGKGNQNGKGNRGKVRTEEQKEHLRQLARAKPNAYIKATCPHCGYLCPQRKDEKRHFDNCRVLRKANKPDKAPCPHCGKSYGIYYLINHVDNCKYLKDLERSDKTPCPHCGLLYGVYLKTHIEKCKHKPVEV